MTSTGEGRARHSRRSEDESSKYCLSRADETGGAYCGPLQLDHVDADALDAKELAESIRAH